MTKEKIYHDVKEKVYNLFQVSWKEIIELIADSLKCGENGHYIAECPTTS